MRSLILSISLLLPCLILQSQTIIEQLGAVKLNCKITSQDSVVLNNAAQFLINRAVKNQFKNTQPNGSGYAYAFGYNEIHLEFMTDSEIRTKEGIGRVLKKYVLRFFNENNQTIAYFDLGKEKIKKVSNGQKNKRISYSINLQDIPMVIFNEVDKIDITYLKRR